MFYKCKNRISIGLTHPHKYTRGILAESLSSEPKWWLVSAVEEKLHSNDKRDEIQIEFFADTRVLDGEILQVFREILILKKYDFHYIFRVKLHDTTQKYENER